MEKEIWKDIKGYPNYQVSNLGNVYSKNRERNLSLGKHRQGYKTIILSSNGETKGFKVHRLVAIAFIENPLGKPEVNHINAIKSDNKVENLEWATPKENGEHSKALGLREYPCGEKHPGAKIKNKHISVIQKMRKNGSLLKEIAEEFNITPQRVYQLCKKTK